MDAKLAKEIDEIVEELAPPPRSIGVLDPVASFCEFHLFLLVGC